jgi:hypothetical protein
MNTKIKKLYFLAIGLTLLFSSTAVFANPIVPESYLSITSAGFTKTNLVVLIPLFVSLCLGMEIFFGYLFFFRHDKLGVAALFFANLISYPIFLILTIATRLLSVTLGEILVIIIEAVILKLFLEDRITTKKAIIISVVLNLISIILSVVIFIMYDIAMSSSMNSNF